MYHNGAVVLPATGLGVAIWWPLAGFAIIALGLALIRMGGTFGKKDD